MGGLVCFHLPVRYPYLISGIIFLTPAFREIKGDRVLTKKIGHCLGCIFPKASIIRRLTIELGIKWNIFSKKIKIAFQETCI